MRVNVIITNISAERFWDIKKPIPPIQIGTNINILSMKEGANNSLEVPFVLVINYKPSIAQISLRGTAYVSGEKSDITKVLEDHEKKPIKRGVPGYQPDVSAHHGIYPSGQGFSQGQPVYPG